MLNCYFGDDIIIFMKFYMFIKFMLNIKNDNEYNRYCMLVVKYFYNR